MSDSNNQRPTRKRASRACQQCRLRKVKCNLVKARPPCNNCQFDGSECITSASKRGRKYRLKDDQRKDVRTSPQVLLPLQQQSATSAPSTAPNPNHAIPNQTRLPSSERDLPNAMPTDGSHAYSSFGSLLNTSVKYPSMSALPPAAWKSSNCSHLPSYIRPPRRELRPVVELEFLKAVEHCRYQTLRFASIFCAPFYSTSTLSYRF